MAASFPSRSFHRGEILSLFSIKNILYPLRRGRAPLSHLIFASSLHVQSCQMVSPFSRPACRFSGDGEVFRSRQRPRF